MVNYLISLIIMIGGLWRTAHASCSIRPSFIVSLQKGTSFHNSGRRKRPRSSLVQRSFTTTTTTQPNDNSNDAQHDFAQQLNPFTWPQLINLFRSSSDDSPNNKQKNNDDHYIPSDHPKLELFRRSAAAQELYDEHKVYINNYWKSAYDYLIVDKFGKKFGIETDIVKVDYERSEIENGNQATNKNSIPPNGYVYTAKPSLAEASRYTIDNQMTYLRLVLNDFPYDVDEGIEHWCLWKIGGKCNTEGILRGELSWAVNELKSLHADEESGSSCIIGKEGVSFYEMDSVETTPFPVADTLYWVNPPHLQSMPNIHHAHLLAIRSDNNNIDNEENVQSICPPPV